MDDFPTWLTIILVALASAVAIIYASRWLLLLFYYRDLTEGKLYGCYDKFANEQITKMLENSSGKLPHAYTARTKLHQDQRQSAYLYCVRYMQVRAILGVIILFPAIFIFVHSSLFLYLGDLSTWHFAVPTLSLLLSVILRRLVLKQDVQFYCLHIMGLAFRKLTRKK